MRLGIGLGLGLRGGTAYGAVGGLAATSGDATLSATGKVLIAGVLAAISADATLVGTAQARITGAMSATSEESTGASAGTHSVQGVAAITTEAATLSGAGTVKVQGSLAATSADATASAAGAVKIQGALAVTLGAATLAATGTVSTPGPAFNDLTLDNYDVDEDAELDSVVATISGGLGAPYEIMLVSEDSAFYSEDSALLLLGQVLDYETAPTLSITLREFDVGDPGGSAAPTLPYHDTVIEIIVNNVAEDLITNSGFTGDGAPWVAEDLGGGTSCGAGEATLNDPDDNGEKIRQDIGDGSAGTYHLTYNVTGRTSGTMAPTVNGAVGATVTTTGAKAEDIIVPTLTGSPQIIFQRGSGGLPVGFVFTDVHLVKTA
jgi:hypothetical protein